MTEITSETFSVRWNSQTQDENARQVACFACRRRKVKCDKRKPCCRTCVQTHQDCKYPVDVARPGPKLGSRHGLGGRNRGTRGNPETLTAITNRRDDARVRDSRTIDDIEPFQARSDIDSEPGRDGVQISPSWILHNFHEMQSYQIPENDIATPSESPASLNIPRTIQSSNADYICEALQIPRSTVDQLRPTFYVYLYTALTPKLSAALAAAMFAFSARFAALPGRNIEGEGLSAQLSSQRARAGFYFEKASQLTAEILRELGDDSPPLGLLQAMTINASHEMVNAARGKAWRTLGVCIRLAYELRLHEVDASVSWPGRRHSATTTESWIMDEERRRVWWALWELDVFISSVSMLPASIQDSHNATLLPVEDEAWFEGRERESSFLEADPVRRWKQLQQSGNQSGRAWYIVINSFTRDVHCLSHLTRPLPRFEEDQGGQCSKLAAKLDTLANCVSCFTLALPESLAYERFSPADNIDWESRRRMSERHVIHLMCQLTRLYIHHDECFNRNPHTRSTEKVVSRTPESPGPSFSGTKQSSTDLQHTTAWRDYVGVSDQMSQVICNSHIDHVRYGHPLLVNTYWMVAAIQLLRKGLARSEEESQLAQSNFDLIKLTLQRHQKFWNGSATPLANLAALDMRLGPIGARSRKSDSTSGKRPATISHSNGQMTSPHENGREDSTGSSNRHLAQSSAAMGTAGTMPMEGPYSFAQQDQSLQQVFTSSSNAVGQFPRVEDDDPSELFVGTAIDDGGLQAYMDSILSNRWNYWSENIDFENVR